MTQTRIYSVLDFGNYTNLLRKIGSLWKILRLFQSWVIGAYLVIDD